MDWQKLKDKTYYEDGSFRDMLVKDTTVQDWALWADFVNANYRVRIDDHETIDENGRIDIRKVNKFWEDEELGRFYATVFVGNVLVNVHFFDQFGLENDIWPQEVRSIEDHEHIIAYMMAISEVLNKEIILTPDSSVDEALITVIRNHVFYNLT